MSDQEEKQLPIDNEILIKYLGESSLNLIVTNSIIKNLEKKVGELMKENHDLRNGDKNDKNK